MSKLRVPFRTLSVRLLQQPSVASVGVPCVECGAVDPKMMNLVLKPKGRSERFLGTLLCYQCTKALRETLQRQETEMAP